MQTTFRGFELFKDIEDAALRNRNRAVVLCNIAEDNTKNSLISPKGASLILGYFNAIPVQERDATKDEFAAQMKQRGFKLNE